MKRQRLSVMEILHLWLETVIGPASTTRPKGYDNSTDSGAMADTRRRAAAVVESVPGYAAARWRLIEDLQGGAKLTEYDYEFVDAVKEHLEKYLMACPFYPTTALQMIEAAKHTIEMRTADSVAQELGITRNCLIMRINDRKTALPYGTFRDDKKKWHIHPYDVEFLKKCTKFENISDDLAS